MAPLPVIADVYRCALEWTDSDTSQTATNVMHFHQAGTNPAALAAILDAHVTASMWGVQPQHAHIFQVNITPLDGGSITFPFATGSVAKWSGNDASTDYTPQVSNIIKLLTSKRGRSYRGRLFLPFVVEATNTQGQLSGAAVTALQAAWVAFLAAMTAAGPNLVVASYKLATADNVVAVLAEKWTATQRRRLPRLSL